jgi:hypothetical protein
VTQIATPPNASSGWWAGFTSNGITRYDQGAYGLVGGVAAGFCAAVELSDAERDQLQQLCRQRLARVKLLRVVLPEKGDPAGQGA